MFGNRRRPISVVFDGYSQSSTKDDCHNKRQPISSLSIEFSLHLEKKLLCKKPVYLSNPSNKQAFVNALAKSLQDAGHEVFQSPDDADLEIVIQANHEVGSDYTILVGDDTDLLVLLIHYFKSELQNTENNMYMFRPSSNSCIDVRKVVEKFPKSIVDQILFIHAASGCDTVSGLAGIGKTKFMKSLLKDTVDFSEFYNAHADVDVLQESGCHMIAHLYNPKGGFPIS